MSNYRRKNPVLKYKRVIIAVEGKKREKQYFEWFQTQVRQGITVVVLPPPDKEDNTMPAEDNGGVKPHEVLARLQNYCTSAKNAVDKADELWLVFDCDKNDYDKYHTMEELKNEMERVDLRSQNRFLAPSNPCLEVWLHLHLEELDTSKPHYSQKLKQKVGAMNNGSGFDSKLHITPATIQAAIARAKAIDKPQELVPPNPGTRVYQLAEVLMELVNNKT